MQEMSPSLANYRRKSKKKKNRQRWTRFGSCGIRLPGNFVTLIIIFFRKIASSLQLKILEVCFDRVGAPNSRLMSDKRGVFVLESSAKKKIEIEKEIKWFDEPVFIDDFKNQLKWWFGWVLERTENDARNRYLFKGWKLFFEETDMMEHFHYNMMPEEVREGIVLQTHETEVFKQLGLPYKKLSKKEYIALTNDRKAQYICTQAMSYWFTRAAGTERELHMAFSDCDIYKVPINTDELGISKEDAIQAINDLVEQGIIPKPTGITVARGILPFWLHEPIPHFRVVEWRRLQDYIYKALKAIGSDAKAKDSVRYVRAAGSIHEATGEKIYILANTYDRYDFDELYNTYVVPALPKPKTRDKDKEGKLYEKKATRRVLALWARFKWGSDEQLRSLHYTRLQDIIKLVELRGYDVEGFREHLCFLYRYWHLCVNGSVKDAAAEMLAFYGTFKRGMHEYGEKELLSKTHSAEVAWQDWIRNHNRGYNYKNESLIDLLEITDAEQKQLQTILSKTEHQRRNTTYQNGKRKKSGTKTHAENKADKLAKIQAALKEKPDASVRELAEKTGYSVGTIHGYLKKI